MWRALRAARSRSLEFAGRGTGANFDMSASVRALKKSLNSCSVVQRVRPTITVESFIPLTPREAQR